MVLRRDGFAHDTQDKPVQMDAASDTDATHDFSDSASTARRRAASTQRQLTGKSTEDGAGNVTDLPTPPTQRLNFPWIVLSMVAIGVVVCVFSRGYSQYSHGLTMKQPVSDLLQEVASITSSQVARRDPDDVINLMNNEKFQHRTGAYKFVCQASEAEQTVRNKLQGSLLPEPVVNGIARSLALDEEVSMSEKKFAVDGEGREGHSFQYRIRSSSSEGKMSVALMYSSISFNMQKVVAGYKTSEEPVYETKVVGGDCGLFFLRTHHD